MKRSEPLTSLTEVTFRPLHDEYKAFVERLKARWLRDNNHRPNIWVLYETDPREQERVHSVICRWEEYITPIAEAWWRRRGVGIRWPKEPDGRCEYYLLEAQAA